MAISSSRHLNRQNDRVYIKEGTKKPLNKKTIVEKNKFSRKLMVWAGVAYNLKTDLVFFRQGVTVNADLYQSAILVPVVVPLCRQHNLIFQQDSAPCYTATSVAEFLRTENIYFWTKEDWPPNSPDLNPLDYGIWGMLEQEVYRMPPKNSQDLESKIRRAWENLDLSCISPATEYTCTPPATDQNTLAYLLLHEVFATRIAREQAKHVSRHIYYQGFTRLIFLLAISLNFSYFQEKILKQ